MSATVYEHVCSICNKTIHDQGRAEPNYRRHWLSCSRKAAERDVKVRRNYEFCLLLLLCGRHELELYLSDKNLLTFTLLPSTGCGPSSGGEWAGLLPELVKLRCEHLMPKIEELSKTITADGK
jgi:hypothetical protein